MTTDPRLSNSGRIFSIEKILYAYKEKSHPTQPIKPLYFHKMLQKPIFKRKRCKDRPSPYKCFCGKSYQTKDALSKHKKDIHKENLNSSSDRKEKKFEGQKGRPSLKKHEFIYKSSDYESSLMEEEIYEKTLLLLLETEMSLQVNKNSIICNSVEEFSNLFAALKEMQNPYESEDPEVECFLNEIRSQKIKLEEGKIPTESKHNGTQPAVKKLAFLVMKSADFLKPVFLQYFLLLNVEILRAQFKKSSFFGWNKCLDFYMRSELANVFEKNHLLDFNKRHQDNVVAFLNKNMPTKQEFFGF